MAKNNQGNVEIEPQKRVGDLPAAMPDDEPARDPIVAGAVQTARMVDENVHFQQDKNTGEVRADFRGLPINPSSHYPGRNQELLDHDMALPTVVDLAKRAKAANSQVPERVIEAGLTDEDGNITLDVEEAEQTDFTEDDEELEDEDANEADNL